MDVQADLYLWHNFDKLAQRKKSMAQALNIESLSAVNQALIIVLSLVFVLQMLYWALVPAGILSWKPGKTMRRRFPVSIIICARNEAENLRKNLPRILEQDYPEYEVRVIDDASSDETSDILRDLQVKYPHLRTTTIQENLHKRPGKKLALTIGIKGAAHEWVLLTDADCRPAGRKWLRTMQGNFTHETQIVLGIGRYETRKGLLNLVLRSETLFTALQYTGFAMSGIPYMGVGRNLAYRKSVFFNNKGFANHYELASGDDDLFVNEVAGRTNTRIEIRHESHTISEPKMSWREWYFQKRRHLTTGPRYRPSTRLLLRTEVVSRILFYVLLIILALNGIFPPLLLALFLARGILTAVILHQGMRRLEEKYLLLPSLILDLVYPWFQAILVFSNFVAKKRDRWK